MSSHHIVKDQQEPALYIQKAIYSADYEIISNLLEWSPIVIVDENSLDFALEWNIKIDVVLCKAENYSAIEEKVIFQFPIEIIICKMPSTQNAFEYLLQKEHYALNIYCADFSTNDIFEIQDFTEKLKIVFFDAEKMLFILKKVGKNGCPKIVKSNLFVMIQLKKLIPKKMVFIPMKMSKDFG